MSSDDEAFNQFIVTSEDEDDKENGAAKSTKTNQNQFDMMILFSKEIDKLKLTKAEHDNHWHELTDKLNEIGPPMRGCWEWRRVWSVYKYNQKRKQPASIQSNMKRRSNPDAPFSVRPPAEQLPSTLQFPELIGPVTVRTAVESRSNPDAPFSVRPPAGQLPSTLQFPELIGPVTMRTAVESQSNPDALFSVRPPAEQLPSTLQFPELIGPVTVRTAVESQSNPDAPFSVRPPAGQLPSTLQFPELIGPVTVRTAVESQSNPDAPFSVRPPAGQLPSTLQFPELIGPVTMRTAVESQSNPDICPPADTITPSALPCNEQIIQSITVPVMTKLTEMVNILKESNELLKQLVARQLE